MFQSSVFKFQGSYFICILAFISCKKDSPLSYNPIVTDLQTEFRKEIILIGDAIGFDIAEYQNHYLIAGSVNSFNNEDMCMVKLDIEGNLIWAKYYGGPGMDKANSILATNSGNYLLAGNQSGFGTNENNACLILTDTSGNLISETAYGGLSDEYFSQVISDDNNFIAAGFSSSYGAGGDIFLVKTNHLLEIIWEKNYGGENAEAATGIAKHPDGGYMVLAYTYSFGATDRDILVLRISEEGDSLWSKIIGTSEYDEPQAISNLSDSGFAISAHSAGFNHPEHNMYLIKISVEGNVEWQNNFGGAKHDGAYDIAENANRIITVGRTNSFGNGNEKIYMINIDRSGKEY